MKAPVDRREQCEKLLSIAALSISLELMLFKFLPDIGTAAIQHGISSLTDFKAFEQRYIATGSVHHARFLGNYLLYGLAKLISTLPHSLDPRLHPLRIAAGVLTPVYAYVGAHFALRSADLFAWRDFIVSYGLTVLIGQYVFYPGDMPSLALLSVSLYFLLRERRVAALLLMLVTGLFRESAFHMVWMVAAWALCDRSTPVSRRVAWTCVFAGAFVLEYCVVRHYFPGPLSAANGIILDPRALFLDRGMLSLTTLGSLGLAALFPIATALRARDLPARDGSRRDWHRAFFLLNCAVFPAWIVFYRMMDGNLSEFRMLWPALLPCIYGLAYFGRLSHDSATPGAPLHKLP